MRHRRPSGRARRRGGADPLWLDRNGNPVETHPNTYADTDRMDAGKPDTPLPWGSVVGAVPGMNAGPSYRPLAPGDVVVTRPAWGPASPSPGCRKARCPARCRGMQAGPGQGPLSPADPPACSFYVYLGAGEADQRRRRRRRLFRQQRMPGIGDDGQATRSPSASRS